MLVIYEVGMIVCSKHVPEEVHIQVEFLDTDTIDVDVNGDKVAEFFVVEADAKSIPDGCSKVLSLIEMVEREGAKASVLKRKKNDG